MLASVALCIGWAMLVQWVAFVPAYLMRTERFYDLVGSFTYLSTVGIALFLAPDLSVRQLVVAAMVALWAGRLGLFLARRVHKAGKDGRFDQIKQSAPRFLVAWTLQGLWVSLTLAAAFVVLLSGRTDPLNAWDLTGALIWTVGFALEVIADRQKSSFKDKPENQGRFIDVGLWSKIRHPNYLGEIVLWIGVAVIASGLMSGWTWLGWVSPMFVFVLLRFVSGVPLLEERAEARWGDDPSFQAYKERTGRFLPGL